MKTPKHIPPVILTCVALLLCGISYVQATVVTSFEQNEGFNPGGLVVNPGSPASKWTFNSTAKGGRAFVSGSYAYAGVLSLAMTGGSTTATANRNYDADVSPYTSFSYSFISPNASYSSLASTSWTYLFLQDGGTTRNIQIHTRFGSSPTSQNQITYYTWDSSGNVITSVKNVSSSQLNFNTWNTLSLVVDYTANTYSIDLNGSLLVGDIAMPNTWHVSNIAGVELVSGSDSLPGGGYATTYYDEVVVTSAVPEPSVSMAILTVGIFAVGYWKIKRKIQKRVVEP